MTNDCQQFPLSGHVLFCRQLRVTLALVSAGVLLVSCDFRICCDQPCLLDVVHAAVVDLDCVAVEDFSEFVVFVEMLVNEAGKFASDACWC